MSMARKKYMSSNESDRLQRIISAARNQLETLGIEGMTMRSLAAESLVSPATLYNRFGSKDNIISLVIIDNFENYIDSRRSVSNKAISPLDSLLTLIKLERESIRSKPTLSKALVSMYFKQNNERELSNHLLAMMRERVVPILNEMKEKKLILAWVDNDFLGNEISDRYLAVVLKWCQNEFRDKELFDHICFSVLSSLAAFSLGAQLKEVRGLLQKITARIS